ncbi:MAG: hypothetical protein M1825_005111 [Sarcosagium campestre]|nr:MAG: hypothetical protein M1825_005111 [Sarcosagium campestre]
MRGVIVSKPGAPMVIAENLEKPTPGPNQILVRSIFTAINPVDGFMQGTGLLVTAWPIVLGCDTGGIVVDMGKDVVGIRPSDEVCGCTRLGIPGYATFQEYFVMDAALAIPKPTNISLEQAATVGVGTYTASLGLINGLQLKFPAADETPSFDEWVVILGGAGSVGQYAIQIAKICGYKVVTSCSVKSEELVKKLGADAIIDYRKSEEEQLAALKSITGGNFSRVFDTVAKPPDTPLKALKELSSSPIKRFATTDDWTPMGAVDGVSVYRIALGPIGRETEEAATLNESIKGFIPHLVRYLANGALKPNDYELVGKPGLESIIEAYALQSKGQGGGKKIIAKIQP